VDKEIFEYDSNKVKSIVMCCLCPVFHGGIKPTTDGRWVHLCCAFWTDGLARIDDLGDMSPIDVSSVPLVMSHAVAESCQFCGMYGGYLAKCSHSGDSSNGAAACKAVFHPICAWFEGAFISAELLDPTFQGRDGRGVYPHGLKFTFLCEKHGALKRANALVKDEQHVLRSKYRIVEEDLEQIPGRNKRKRQKKKRKPLKESSGRISASANLVKELNKDAYDDKFCAICFNPLSNNVLMLPTGKVDGNPQIGEEEKLKCSECSLTVHSSCFVGRLPSPDSFATWKCASCTEKIDESESCNIKCILCPRTGGFFLPTIDSTWVHAY
jgi:hypothetical protein